MSGKLWNNQGGSDFHGGSKKKDRIKKPEDPFKSKSIDELKESDVTSFRLVKQRKALPHYGDFGDAVWVYDLIPDDIKDLEAPQRFRDLSTTQPTEARPFREIEDIRDVPTDKNSDLSRPIKSQDLIPYSVSDEYELIVKFKKVILMISSGQAFAARNRINDPRYDRSIVIQSTQPIILNTSIFIIEQNTTPRTVNIIQLRNGFQDPVFSLYNWMLTKIKIITDGTGKNPDNELLALSRQNGITELPRTIFSYNDKDYGLFYAPEGIQPYQVCMHARDDVLKFVAGNPKDDRYWSVLNSNMPLSLCTPNVPTVSVRLANGSASELEAGGGMSFVLDVVVEPDQEIETLVEFETLGSANPGLYTVTGTSLDVDNIPVVNIPITNDKQILIEPSVNPGQTGNRTIIFKLKENDRYLIDNESVELTILPRVVVGIPCIFFRTKVVTTLFQSNFVCDLYVTGSNDSVTELGQSSLGQLIIAGDSSVPPFGLSNLSPEYTKMAAPPRQVLFEPQLPVPYVDTYGKLGNYFTRSHFFADYTGVGRQEQTKDYFISKRIVTDWAASTNVRYIVIQAHGIGIFDKTRLPAIDTPDPAPTRSFPDYFGSRQIAFGSMMLPTEGLTNIELNSIPATDSLGLYPNDVVDKFYDGNLLPIQMNIFNEHYQPPSSPLYRIGSFRSALNQSAIEFDLQTDPNMLNPRVIPIVVDTNIDTPLVAPNNNIYTTSYQTFLPYQQLTPPVP